MYKLVDMDKFERIEHYCYFRSVGTKIEFTSKIDVNKAVEKCRKEKISFYGYMIFNITKAINKIENFRLGILDEKLVEWREIIPTFTNLNDKTKTFFTLWSEVGEDYREFDKIYKSLVNEYRDSKKILPQSVIEKNVFNISAIPNLHFEHFSSNSKSDEKELTTKITMGQYKEIDSKTLMPVTLQASHAIVDGYHISEFFRVFQILLNN